MHRNQYLIDMCIMEGCTVLDDSCTECGTPEDWEQEMTFNLEDHIARQIEFSAKTFGPGARTQGVIDHIRKELCEIEADPTDVEEWIDVIILGIDGAWRAGFTPAQIVDAIVAKQAKNEARDWPDWRTVPHDKAIEHNRLVDNT